MTQGFICKLTGYCPAPVAPVNAPMVGLDLKNNTVTRQIAPEQAYELGIDCFGASKITIQEPMEQGYIEKPFIAKCEYPEKKISYNYWLDLITQGTKYFSTPNNSTVYVKEEKLQDINPPHKVLESVTKIDGSLIKITKNWAGEPKETEFHLYGTDGPKIDENEYEKRKRSVLPYFSDKQ